MGWQAHALNFDWLEECGVCPALGNQEIGPCAQMAIVLEVPLKTLIHEQDEDDDANPAS